MGRKSSKRKPSKGNDGKGGGSSGESGSSRDRFSSKEIAKELEIEGKAEAVRILDWLILTASVNGNTFDIEVLRKILKESFGIELKKGVRTEAELESNIKNIQELKVKQWQQE